MSEVWSDQWICEQMAKLDKAQYRICNAYDELKRIRDDRRMQSYDPREGQKIEKVLDYIEAGIKIAQEVWDTIPYDQDAEVGK